MPHQSSAEYRRLQHQAERMAKLSPFAADREKFERIARGYLDKADDCSPDSKGPGHRSRQ